MKTPNGGFHGALPGRVERRPTPAAKAFIMGPQARTRNGELLAAPGGRPEGGLCGFLEAALRSRADGCETTPVGYIEGWYVDPDVRRRGIGRALVEAAEAWAKSQGCRQMASDAELWNDVSHQVHGAL